MKMLVLCQADFVFQFTDRYAIEELGDNGPQSLKKVNTYSQFLQEACDGSYAFYVIEIGVILSQCESEQIADCFAALQGSHVTVLGSALEFSLLPQAAINCISTFFNTEGTMNEESPLYIEALQAKHATQQEDIPRTFFTQICQGRQLGDMELHKLGSEIHLWESNSCVFVICLDLTGSDAHILDQVTPTWLEQFSCDTLQPPKYICFVQKSDTVIFGVIVFQEYGVAKQNYYVNTYTSYLYTSVLHFLPAPVALTLGVSSLQCNKMVLPKQFSEAADAAFCRVYDGAGRIYYSRKQSDLSGFKKNKYMKNLRDAIDKREIAGITQCLDELFDKIAQYRLPELLTAGILMEIMSMMYMLCVEENLNIADFNDNTQDSIDFLFLQNIISIKQEHNSFIEHFARILDKVAENKDILSTYSTKVRKGIRYIRENYQNSIQLRDIAAFSDLSPNYFCSTFRKETGSTVVEYLNTVRIEHAKELLRTTDLSAADVSNLTGFSDSAYFCSVFKRITGYTVTDFRKKTAQE